jgi:hypothetical protein
MSTSMMTTQKTKAFHRLAVMLLLKLLCFASGLWRDFKQLLGTRNRMANAHRFYQINKQSTARQRCKPDWVCRQVLRLKAHMPHGTGVRKIAQTFNCSQAGKSKMTVLASSDQSLGWLKYEGTQSSLSFRWGCQQARTI